MKKSILILCLLLFACKKATNKSNPLTLVIENRELKVGKNYNGINVITYSIANNSSTIYYINNFTNKIKLPLAITKEYKYLRAFQDSKECKYYPRLPKPSGEYLDCEILQDEKKRTDHKNLGYKKTTMYELFNLEKTNFFIYPNQKLYFEYYVSIDNFNYAPNQFLLTSLDYSKKNNYATLSIASDSSTYKRNLPRNILKTIKVNNVKVYHGIIESKNKVPIKILK